jgi:hypothetical protein
VQKSIFLESSQNWYEVELLLDCGLMRFVSANTDCKSTEMAYETFYHTFLCKMLSMLIKYFFFYT